MEREAHAAFGDEGRMAFDIRLKASHVKTCPVFTHVLNKSL